MNEEANIELLLDSIYSALIHIDFELILIDDGSTDQTVNFIKQFSRKNTKLIVFNRNFGQTTAISAGIDIASGELIATLDGDLQNDPFDIPLMIKKMEQGDWDVIAGKRKKRQDRLLLRKIPSKIANWLIRTTTGVKISDYGCTLKLFTHDVAKNLCLYGELHRYIPVLATMYGAKMTEVDVKHHARRFGKSKYGLGRTFKVISDLMLIIFLQKYGQKPMHLFGFIGNIMLSFGIIIDLYLFTLKILGHSIGDRPLLILGAILTLGGIQLITTGFIAELNMRIYYEAQKKKPYVIKECFNKN